jgi:hypothetical protein
MNNIYIYLIAILLLLLIVFWFLLKRSRSENDSLLAKFNEEATRIESDYTQRVLDLEREILRIREHYMIEARRVKDDANSALIQLSIELENLRRFSSLLDAEIEVEEKLKVIIAEAEMLQRETQEFQQRAKMDADKERKAANEQAKQTLAQAEASLSQARKDADNLLANAEREAVRIAESAYTALREKEVLEQTIRAIRNVVDGYGDRYIIPTHSLLDELAADFGHLAAGNSLKIARDQSKRMSLAGETATCDYAEANRRATAIRFITGAFNGFVDAILSRVSCDNFGTLEQEIRDAFSLVNLNGEAFRNARILPAYLDSRIDELKWAVVTQELRRKEREEQRRIQEQIREEEKARRDYERAVQEAAREEANIRKAMEQARQEADAASEEEREKLSQQLADLELRLQEAEAKNQRALSMAQQTRAGNVYIISNIGSFGEGVLKIGMTRRLDPLDRVKELGDASVPFEFDVHAIIHSQDAPSLEKMLHQKFDDYRLNKVNYRKEFFRVPIELIREIVCEQQLEATFTMVAAAREYRESLAYEKMSSEDRFKFHSKESSSSIGED